MWQVEKAELRVEWRVRCEVWRVEGGERGVGKVESAVSSSRVPPIVSCVTLLIHVNCVSRVCIRVR